MPNKVEFMTLIKAVKLEEQKQPNSPEAIKEVNAKIEKSNSLRVKRMKNKVSKML